MRDNSGHSISKERSTEAAMCSKEGCKNSRRLSLLVVETVLVEEGVTGKAVFHTFVSSYV
jgi:hypothetical protein